MIQHGLEDMKCSHPECSYINHPPQVRDLIIPGVSQNQNISVSWNFFDPDGDSQERYELQYSAPNGSSGHESELTQQTTKYLELGDGDWTITLRARDHGMWSRYSSGISYVDTTKPIVEAQGLGFAGPSGDGNISITSKVNDNLDLRSAETLLGNRVVHYQDTQGVYSNTVLYNPVFNVYELDPPIEPGAYNMAIRVTDRAGNVGSHSFGSVIVQSKYAELAGIKVIDPSDPTRYATEGTLYLVTDLEDWLTGRTVTLEALKDDPSKDFGSSWPKWGYGDQKYRGLYPGQSSVRFMIVEQPFFVYDRNNNTHQVNVEYVCGIEVSNEVEYKLDSTPLKAFLSKLKLHVPELEYVRFSRIGLSKVPMEGSPELGYNLTFNSGYSYDFGTGEIPLGPHLSLGIDGTPFHIQAGIYAIGTVSVSMSTYMVESNSTGSVVYDVDGSLSLSAEASLLVKVEALVGEEEGEQKGLQLVGEAKLTGVDAEVTPNSEKDRLQYQFTMGALSINASCELKWGKRDWKLFDVEIPVYEGAKYPETPGTFWRFPGPELWDTPIVK